MGDLQGVAAPEYVGAFADEEVDVVVLPVLRDDEAAVDGHFRAADLGDVDVGDEVRGARTRLFGPVIAALDLLDTFGEVVLAFIEPVRIGALARVLGFGPVERHVARDRHIVARIVGEEVQPFGEAAVVEQFRFAGVKRLDFALQQQLRKSGLVGVRCDTHAGSVSFGARTHLGFASSIWMGSKSVPIMPTSTRSSACRTSAGCVPTRRPSPSCRRRATLRATRDALR